MRTVHACSLAVVVAIATSGCRGDIVGPSAAAQPVDIAGTWQGTKYVEWDPIDGGGNCTMRVVATFGQNGAVVTGSIRETETVTCSFAFDANPTPELFDGVVESPFVYLGFRAHPNYARAMAHLEGDTLVINWFNVRWTLTR